MTRRCDIFILYQILFKWSSQRGEMEWGEGHVSCVEEISNLYQHFCRNIWQEEKYLEEEEEEESVGG